jgi:hypothetical protein
LFVIIRGDGEKVQPKKIGSCAEGKVLLDDQAAELRVEGRLLYVSKTN